MVPHRSWLVIAALCSSLTGCIAFQTPRNAYNLGGTDGYMSQRGAMPGKETASEASADLANMQRCTLPAPTPPSTPVVLEEPLSPGDLVRVDVYGGGPPTGTYKVDASGSLSLLGTDDLPVVGLTITEAQNDLNALLVRKQLFRSGFAHANLRILQRGAARIVVTGAVFQAGQVTINQPAPTGVDTVQETAIGDYAINRTLSDALSFAGGVRPDADLSRITLVHDGQTEDINLTGVLSGQPFANPVLSDGDIVTVPSRHCFQMELARPTPITPPGVKIYISNLTTPAANNAGADINHDTTSFPYGTRLLQVLAGGNCVGGTQFTNADRYAVLITTNPETGDSEVLERRIEELVRRPDRDAYNPVIMPGDAVACYDSKVQNVRDVLKSLGDFGLALSAGKIISGL